MKVAFSTRVMDTVLARANIIIAHIICRPGYEFEHSETITAPAEAVWAL
jgi:hypothetical protein